MLKAPIILRRPVQTFTSKTIREKTKEKGHSLEAKAAARQKYREAHDIVNPDCRDNLAQLEEFAKVQVVTFPSGKYREIKSFPVTALGEPFGITGVTVTRWLNAGMIPAPELVTGRGKVYHIEEVRSFINIVGEHQQQFRQYRKEHIDITDRLFRENALLRQSIFN